MNVLKTGLLLTILTLLFVFLGRLLGGQQGMVMAFVFAVIMNLGAYWFSDKMVLAMYRAKPLSQSEAPELYEILQELTRRANMPMPKVYLVPQESPNAFATGRSPQHAVVAVTTGILRLLSRDELRGVLAHELGHVRNRDILVMSIAATVAGAIAMLANMARWGMMFGGRRDDRRGGGAELIMGLVLLLLAPIAATLIQLAISRTREYGADESGARLCRGSGGLVSALRKLDEASKQIPLRGVNPAAAQLCIVNALHGDAIATLFATHPPMAKRIERLRQVVL